MANSYGLPKGERERRFEEQDKACFICGKGYNKPNKMHLDHDHMTGQIRSLLCPKCNTAIGKCKEKVNVVRELEKEGLVSIGSTDYIINCNSYRIYSMSTYPTEERQKIARFTLGTPNLKKNLYLASRSLDEVVMYLWNIGTISKGAHLSWATRKDSVVPERIIIQLETIDGEDRLMYNFDDGTDDRYWYTINGISTDIWMEIET